MGFIIDPYRFAGASSLLTDLVAWWSLDETSGTRADSHGSFDLTDNNTVGYTTGKQGNAASIVAANDEYLSHAHHVDLRMGDRDFTVAGWFYYTSSSETSAGIVMKGDTASGDGWAVQRSSTSSNIVGIARNATNTAYVLTPVIAAAVDTWHFFIFEFDTATDTLSLETNRGTPTTNTLTNGSYASETEPFQIGANTPGTRHIDGYIDEVAIWHRILTSDEKDALYNSGSGMAYPG